MAPLLNAPPAIPESAIEFAGATVSIFTSWVSTAEAFPATSAAKYLIVLVVAIESGVT